MRFSTGCMLFLSLIVVLASSPVGPTPHLHPVESPVFRSPDTSSVMNLTIIYTHDIHSHLYPHWSGGMCRGGMPLLADLVERMREDQPNLLLLDCGDTLSGGAVNDHNGGIPMIEIMNAIGYNAMAVDNHEFDLDISALKGMIEAANFDILSANTKWPGTPQAANYTIIEMAGLRIGIIGLTPSFWYAPPSVTFIDMKEAATEAVTDLEGQGVNFTILLGCLGSAPSLAEQIPGLDLIVKGPSGPQLVNGVLIAPSAGSYASSVGVLNISVDTSTGTITSYDFTVRSLQSPPLQPDPEVEAIIDQWNAPLASMLDTPVGYTPGSLSTGDLGPMMAEAIRLRTGADVGTYNHGGVRDSIPNGFITYRDIYHVEPFFNYIATVEAPGWVTEEIVNENYYSTTISSFDPNTVYTLASSNFSVTNWQRIYGSHITNRQDFPDLTVVQVLADYLANQYPAGKGEIRQALSEVRSTVNELPDTVFAGGEPSDLRLSITAKLDEAMEALDEDDEEEALLRTQEALSLVENHINASCPRRWIATTLKCASYYLEGMTTTTTTNTTSTTTPPLLPPLLAAGLILVVAVPVIVVIAIKWLRRRPEHSTQHLLLG